MEWAQLEQTFSKPRLSRYLKECGNDKGLAEMAYITNIRICEALIPSMSILEVALRNSMDRILRERFKKDDWFDDLLHNHFYKDIHSEITKAKRKGGKNENKVIAELNFGFWTKLLNNKYNNLWKNLRLAFPRCPKQERRRHIVSKKLNNIRVLRNRVSHHEPILWLDPSIKEQYESITLTINWLNPDIITWLNDFDRFRDIWNQIPNLK